MVVERDASTPAEGQADGMEAQVADGQQARNNATFRNAVSQLVFEWIRSLVVAFILFIIIRTFLVEAYRIPSASMENTLLVGDFLLVNKAAFGAHVPFTRAHLPALSEPKRGDVIVFVPPHVQDQNYVKRLIGAPGDTVEMRNKALYVDGVVQREPYAHYSGEPDVYSRDMDWQCDYRPSAMQLAGCRPSRDNWGPIAVPSGKYLMLGDNRDDSEDSRYWGFIDESAMLGKPLVVYYSFEPASTNKMPWFSAIRWRRIGSRPH